MPADDVGPAWPSVTAVIATRDRPELLRRAVSTVLAQDYPGSLTCVVVFDRTPVDDLADLLCTLVAPNRTLRTVPNTRTGGLPGSRNTGIGATDCELVAFCDDDDQWRPEKIRHQVELLRDRPDAVAVATGMVIRVPDGTHERIAPAVTTFEDLLRSRVTALHPSSMLFRRTDLSGRVGLAGRIGLVDEDLPGAYGEDYELLLRATRHGPVVSVPEALVEIDWARPSYFAGKWDLISDGLAYILGRVPEFARDRTGRARIEGQIAFAHAARRRRRHALRWAGRAFRDDPRQLRTYGALVVATGIIPAAWLLDKMHGRGRGL